MKIKTEWGQLQKQDSRRCAVSSHRADYTQPDGPTGRWKAVCQKANWSFGIL